MTPDLVKALQNAIDTLEWVYGCTEPNRDEIKKAIDDGNNILRSLDNEQKTK